MRVNTTSLYLLLNVLSGLKTISAAPTPMDERLHQSGYEGEQVYWHAPLLYPTDAQQSTASMTNVPSDNNVNTYWNVHGQSQAPYYIGEGNHMDHSLQHHQNGVYGQNYGAETSSSQHSHHQANIDLSLRLGQPRYGGMHNHAEQETESDTNTPTAAEASSSRGHNPIVQNANQEGSSLATQQTPRLKKLSAYEWQTPLTDNQVMQIYRAVGKRWPPGGKKAMNANLERLNAYLLHYPKCAYDVLESNENVIAHLAAVSAPAFSKFPEDLKEIETIEQLLDRQLTQAAPHIAKRRHASWANGMSLDDQQALVDLLHQAWIKDKQSVKAILARLGPSVVAEWSRHIFGKGKPEAFLEAYKWGTWLQQQRSDNNRRGQIKMLQARKNQWSYGQIEEPDDHTHRHQHQDQQFSHPVMQSNNYETAYQSSQAEPLQLWNNMNEGLPSHSAPNTYQTMPEGTMNLWNHWDPRDSHQ